jgi:hypothetical protein
MAIEVEEQVKEQLDTLYQLLEAFFPPLPAKAAKLLQRERDWNLRWEPQRGKMKVVTIDLALERIVVSIPARVNIPPFSIAKVGEALGVGNGYLYVNEKAAFFQGKSRKDLKETLNLVQAFRPLFDVLGLSDLEEALDALAEFKGEEVRQHGPYVLAWSGKPEDPFLLRRGTIFGNFILDGAFLLGREIVLHYPKAKVVLQGGVFSKVGLKLTKFKLECLEWESVQIQFRGSAKCHALDENPATSLIREAAVLLLERGLPKGNRSTLMVKGLLKAFLEAEDPLEALKDEDFFRQVTLGLLSGF